MSVCLSSHKYIKLWGGIEVKNALFLVIKRNFKKNLGGIFLGADSLRRVMVPSPKLVINIPRTYKKLHCKEEQNRSVCVSLFQSVCLSVCLSVCMYVFMSICMYVCLSFCIYVCLSVYLSIYLSIYNTFSSTESDQPLCQPI